MTEDEILRNSRRKKNAMKILVAMIQSQPPHDVNRHKADAKKWARKAYEFVDALESEGGKQ